MINNDPIREKKTLLEKFKDLYIRIFSRKPKEENYFVSPYEVNENTVPDGTNEWDKLNESFSKMGDAMLMGCISTKDARNALIHFNKVIHK